MRSIEKAINLGSNRERVQNPLETGLLAYSHSVLDLKTLIKYDVN